MDHNEQAGGFDKIQVDEMALKHFENFLAAHNRLMAVVTETAGGALGPETVEKLEQAAQDADIWLSGFIKFSGFGGVLEWRVRSGYSEFVTRMRVKGENTDWSTRE